MFKLNSSVARGFTLIELLVVVAVITLLASIVLASLNSARGKGANAAIKSNLESIRVQAELIFNANLSYTGLCSDPAVVSASNAAAKTFSGTVDTLLGDIGTLTRLSCHESSQAWAVNSALKVQEGANTMWCADSTGAVKGGTSFPANQTNC